MSRPALWIPLLSLAALLFGWETYEAWREPVLPGARPGPAQSFSPPEGEGGDAGGPGESLPAVAPQITAKPLFRPDRRPYQEPVAAPVPQRNYATELARFNLVGVLLLKDARKGIVVAKSAGKGESRSERWEVGAGDSLPGFTVKEVREEGLLLTADENEFTLPLYAGGPKAQGGEPLRTEVAPPLRPAAAAPQPAAVPQPGVRPQPPPAAASTAAPGAVPGAVPGVVPGAAPAPRFPAAAPPRFQGRIIRPPYVPEKR